MNNNLYKQADSRWGSLAYPTKAYSFAGNGCGCCACLHVIIEQDKYKNWTPKNLRPYMVDQGFATRGNGTTWNGIKLTLEHYGNTVINHATMTDIFKTLDTRKEKNLPCLGVILFRAGTKGGVKWTAGGHYVAFVDYKKSGDKHYFYTKDSGSRNHDGWYCYETTMQGLIPQIWSALPKSVSTTVTVSKGEGYTGKFPSATLKLNSSGTQVKYLQKFLNWYGNYKLTVDGQFGNKTLAAVKDFQTKEGLVVDGIVGIKTRNKMQEVKKNVNNTNNTTTTTPTTSAKVTKLKGVDVSAWQGKISKANFQKVKDAGIKFVILRLGYTGSSTNKPTIDSVFEYNYKNAIAAGLPVGVYFYSLATTADKAKEEANFCVKNLKGKTITYPVYIDVEDPNKQAKQTKTTLATVCNTFCETIKAAGYKPGVYASLSWFNSKIGTITASHSKWVAQYYTECQYKGNYDMWQYSSSGAVAGISGKVDMNYWYNKN